MYVFHYGAEYHYREGHENPSMDEYMRRHTAGMQVPNPNYFRRSKAQVDTAIAIFGLDAGTSVRYGDVTQVNGGGEHAPRDEYQRRVLATRDAVVSEFKSHAPSVAIIAGSEAFLAFRKILDPALGEHRPSVVVRMRNPGSQGHRGATAEAWNAAYANAAASLANSCGAVLGLAGSTRYFALRSNRPVGGVVPLFRIVEEP